MIDLIDAPYNFPQQVLVTMYPSENAEFVIIEDMGWTTSYRPKTHDGNHQTIVFVSFISTLRFYAKKKGKYATLLKTSPNFAKKSYKICQNCVKCPKISTIIQVFLI